MVATRRRSIRLDNATFSTGSRLVNPTSQALTVLSSARPSSPTCLAAPRHGISPRQAYPRLRTIDRALTFRRSETIRDRRQPRRLPILAQTCSRPVQTCRLPKPTPLASCRVLSPRTDHPTRTNPAPASPTTPATPSQLLPTSPGQSARAMPTCRTMPRPHDASRRVRPRLARAPLSATRRTDEPVLRRTCLSRSRLCGPIRPD